MIRAALAFGLIATSCASTKVTELWRAPGFVPKHYETILVVALPERDSTHEAARVIFERTMAGYLAESGYKVVLGSEFLPDDAKEMPREELRAFVENAGIDGAIAMGFNTIRVEDRYKAADKYAVVGGSAQGFYGTYAAYTLVKTGEKEDVPQDRVVVLDASFYDLKGRPGVMWRATTETKNPDNPHEFAQEYVERIVEVMKAQDVL